MAGQNEEVEARMERMEQTNQETMSAIQILLQKFASIEARFHDKGPPGFASFGKLPEQVNQETVSNTVKNSRRPELPLFIGEGPDGWLWLAERYFKLNLMPEKEILKQAMMAMEGEALEWFIWSEDRYPLRDWTDFHLQLQKRFGAQSSNNLLKQLMSLNQEDYVLEYRAEFERISAYLPDLAADVLETAYLRGLKTDIQEALEMHSPIGLRQIMDMSVQTEKFLRAIYEGSKAPILPKGNSTTHPPEKFQGRLFNKEIPKTEAAADEKKLSWKTGSRGSSNTDPVVPTPLHLKAAQRKFLKLTEQEIQKRREKGLCFSGNKKFGPGHRCKKELNIIIVEEEEEEEEQSKLKGEISAEDGADGDWSMVESSAMEASLFTAHVSLHFIMGMHRKHTMKIEGDYQGYKVTVLIDSGASHNFICSQLIDKMVILTHKFQKYNIQLGSGNSLVGDTICKNIPISIQGVLTVQHYLPLKLNCSDVILGVEWLDTLGWVHFQFSQHLMKFRLNDSVYLFRGDPNISKAVDPGCQNIEVSQDTTHLQPSRLTQDEVNTRANTYEMVIKARFPTVFESPKGLPPSRSVDHSIHLLPGVQPVNSRPDRYSHAQKDEIDKQTQELLLSRIIQPSRSPYASLALLVKKKDGNWRLCIDYRRLNKSTIPNRFPIPLVDELLDELHGSTIFSKLDLKSGYYQIRMLEEDIPKTAFKTHQGHYEFKVMPFGLSNAPATFQSLMNSIFLPTLRKFVLVFFDDILIYSKNHEEHVQHLHTVFQLLSDHGLHINTKKCVFRQPKIEYLGHWVSGEGVAADKGKIAAMVDWPFPKSVKELWGFLGLTGYYRRFIEGYAKILAPLTQLLKKNSFVWSDLAQQAFEVLKSSMVKAPVLSLPDFSLPFVLETDASGIGVGAVLMQEGKPICYFS